MSKKDQQQADQDEGAPKGAPSFCIPKTAIEALLDAKASALEICAYLVLARATDATGVFSTAAASAVRRATGSNMDRIDKALKRLMTIRAVRLTRVSNGRSGKSHAWIDQEKDLGPIVVSRDDILKHDPDMPLPDGPHERAKVTFMLSDFGEDLADRVWIGSALVGGVGGFDQPLKALKNAGDVAARLLLAMYQANDMEGWGGVDPHIGPWHQYEPGDREQVLLHGGARLVRAKPTSKIGPGGMFPRTWPATPGQFWKEHEAAGGPCWRALEALESCGLIYEMVMVLNRDSVKATFSSGTGYGAIVVDAEPFYELDCRSQHGYKPTGEEGMGGVTARTASDLQRPLTGADGKFWGYAAIVPRGYGCQIVGIYRLRFRVANPKNAGVRGTWGRIHQNNRDALDLVNGIRKANKLDPLPAPWDVARAAAEQAKQTEFEQAKRAVSKLFKKGLPTKSEDEDPIPF